MDKTGRCLCGATRFTLHGVSADVAACHCSMCRRWAGGPYMAVHPTSVTWDPDDRIATFASSDWAERGFCSACGTTLFYRLRDGAAAYFAAGTLDDLSGLSLTTEIFVDEQTHAWAFAGSTHRMTGAEVFAAHGAPG